MSVIDAPAAMDLTWRSTIAVSVTSSVCVVMVNQGFMWAREKYRLSKQNTKEGLNLASELYINFSTYAEKCYSAYCCYQRYRNGELDMQDGWRDIPNLAPYPEGETAWGAIPPRIIVEIKGFPHEIKNAQKEVCEMLSMNSGRFDPGSAFYESANYQLELGYKSLELAKKLENHYKFKRTPANYALTVELKSEYFRKNPGKIKRLIKRYIFVKNQARRSIRKLVRQIRCSIFRLDR